MTDRSYSKYEIVSTLIALEYVMRGNIILHKLSLQSEVNAYFCIRLSFSFLLLFQSASSTRTNVINAMRAHVRMRGP